MAEPNDWKDLSKKIKSIFEKEEKETLITDLYEAIEGEPAANIALVMEDLESKQACTLFSVLEMPLSTETLSLVAPELAADLISEMNEEELTACLEALPPREAAAIVAVAPKKHVKGFLKKEDADISARYDAEQRLKYPKGSAGRLMTTQFVKLYRDTTVADALEVVKHTDKNVDIPEDLYIIERDLSTKPLRNRLLGIVSIRDLIMAKPEKHVDAIMATDLITVKATAREDDVSALFSKYKFMSIPVVDPDGYLAGVIPSDDLLQVIASRFRRLYNRAVGTDAEKMEGLTPLQEAKLRVPWLLGTMLIELGAGLVIRHFDGILQKVILLASFLPIISAVSGNVGLQAAAITVRAVDSASRTKNMWQSIRKEISTSFLMAIACGLVLGTIGAIWAKHLPFGLVIGGALTCSMVTAGLMGTIIPIFSKRLGFDPATTAGPFETAFQDIVGFAVFLWLATIFQHWIT